MVRCCSALGLALALAALGLSACNTTTGIEQDVIIGSSIEARLSGELVFLAMRVTPQAHMEALFEGAVVQDEAGCLRLDSPDPATVVWPRGWGFERDGEAILIVDADGELVGRTGEEFRLGGGEVETLLDAMGFTRADRDLAESHCPGRYWIVGEPG